MFSKFRVNSILDRQLPSSVSSPEFKLAIQILIMGLGFGSSVVDVALVFNFVSLLLMYVLEFSQGMILPSKDSPVLQRTSPGNQNNDEFKAVVNAPVSAGDANKNKSKWLD